MSGSQKITLYDNIIEAEKKDRIKLKLDLAEAINFAYSGSRSKKASDEYKRWREKLVNELYPESPRSTVWDKIAKSRKVN